MKKYIAFLMMAVTLVACSREMQPDVIEQPEAPATYTLSISASKNADTKALELDENTLNAIWSTSDEVYVFLNNNLTNYVAILRPESSSIYPDKNSCTLTGNFTTLPQANDVLTLRFTSNNYTQQKGTLAYIEKWCDYAEAALHVTGVNNGQIESSEGVASFASQQAIVKFVLKDKATNAAITPTALIVNDGSSNVATVTNIPDDTYTTNGDGVLYVAIPAIDSKTISLSAATDIDGVRFEYTTPSAVSFANGQYYSVTVAKMVRTVYLNEITDNFEAINGDILTSTLASSHQISIASGATVTLRDATIDCLTEAYAGITCNNNATLILEGDNTVVGGLNNGWGDYPGIYIAEGHTLTIDGTGTLVAKCGAYGSEEGDACGIGGGYCLSCGNIEILGGTIIASGGDYSSGIGGGWADGEDADCGFISISGGTITATGGKYSPGIGNGYGGTCLDITISGGTITATGGDGEIRPGFSTDGGAGIGNACMGECGDITINNTVTSVTATKGLYAINSIGKGSNAICGTVTIGGTETGNISTSPYTYPAPALQSITIPYGEETVTIYYVNGETWAEAKTNHSTENLALFINSSSNVTYSYQADNYHLWVEDGGWRYVISNEVISSSNTYSFSDDPWM